MARKTDIWMPWYIMDYQRDTGELTLEEDGFYRRAIDLCWLRQGPIPTDPSRLRNALNVTPAQLKRCIWVLEKFCYKTEDGQSYRNNKIDGLLLEAAKNKEAAVNGAKKTNEKRWGKVSPSDTHSDSQGVSLKGRTSPSSSSSFPSEKNEWFSNPDFAAAWKAWEKSRKLKAGEIQYKALEKLASGSIVTAIAILNQSIELQYRGIFPLKGTANGTRKPSRVDTLNRDAAELLRDLGGTPQGDNHPPHPAHGGFGSPARTGT